MVQQTKTARSSAATLGRTMGIALLISGVSTACAAEPRAQGEPVGHFRANQLGIQAQVPAHVVLVSDAAQPQEWRLEGKGGVVARGMTAAFGEDAASGDPVHRIDVPAVARTGTYTLSVGADSTKVQVVSNPYGPLAKAAFNYFYQARAGTPILAAFAGGERWARPAGHPNEVVGCFSGSDTDGNVWPGCGDYRVDVTGGWYDAGDHGKYVVNGGISVWTLQNLYEVEQARTKGKGTFAKAGKLVPDQGRLDPLLVETRWQMEFMLKMQVADGIRMQLPINQQPGPGLVLSEVDASGMAHHKMGDRNWTGLPMRPHDDPEERLLYPPSTAATLNLAATAAQCARLWRDVDRAFADRCLQAAQRAYAAAKRNPAIYSANFNGSGGYGDPELADDFYWAAAELAVTTGEAGYRADLAASPIVSKGYSEPSWGDTAALGAMTLALQGGADQGSEAKRIIGLADDYLAQQERTGYFIPFDSLDYPWGSNSTLLNRAMLLGVAHRLTGEARYLDGMRNVMDYLLGRNPLAVSYISGFGARAMQHPHHRFWANVLDPSLPPPAPGTVSGGPNSTSMDDPIAKEMQGKCAPQRCWKDDIGAYAFNEVTINWNAPLVWVSAYLADTRP